MTLRSLFQPAPPEVAVEIDATHVGAMRLDGRAARVAAEALPEGAVTPGLASTNVPDASAVGQAVKRLMRALGGRTSRVGLVIPDTAAKVSIVRFETVPPSARDLAELVRWQVRKTVPFPLEQAIVAFTPGAQRAGAHEFVVTVARADVVRQYERACAHAGAHAGLVDLATFSIINGVLAGTMAAEGEDWLLVHAAATYVTLAVLRGEHLIFYRHREQDAEGTLADVVHQTAMYYEDRLQGTGFGRVLLAGRAVHGADAVRRSLEQRLDVRVETVEQPEQATLAGLLARARRAA